MDFLLDDLPFQARSMPDLRFLSQYGHVFWLYDTATSGNLHFGVDGPFGRLFIKYAGAETLNYTGRAEDAVARLKNAVALYQLSHPALLPLLSHGPTGEGYALIFPWWEGVSIRTLPDGTDERRAHLQRLPQTVQLSLFDRVMDLILAFERKGYVTDDFTDTHVLIDLFAADVRLCDIDLFTPFPARNTRGRMHGEADFLSPEEFIPDALITPRATVYHLGKLAFSFFGLHGSDREEHWLGPVALFPIAKKATEKEMEKRYPHAEAFAGQWRGTLCTIRLL